MTCEFSEKISILVHVLAVQKVKNMLNATCAFIQTSKETQILCFDIFNYCLPVY